MPELGARLAALRQIERAERRAKGLDPDDADSASGIAPAWLSQSLPGYSIASESYRGGQGAVYRATQRTTGRNVAIKVVRGGVLPGRSDDVRFRREIQILGRLQHPNIVPIHDSGVVGECHYFVMDFIAGEPLASYVSSHRCAVSQIVQLFVQICDAVHAAHVRGVIHRDLKPSNIRVDSQGMPYILDFGLAKMSTEGGDSAPSQQVTMTGEFVGSLPWASPEQATGSPDLVDLRSDIYSLGVMLYQLLTGHFPYPVSGPMRRVLSNIAELEPVRPRTIHPDFDQDLQAIVLTCLEKDPERRYQSAAALADDLRRLLRHEPVLARSPSAIYRLRKLVRRHRLPAALLFTLSLTVVGFAIAMSILYGRAAVSRDRALLAENLAEQRCVKAEQEAATSEAIKEFLVQDLLASAKPEFAQGRKVTVEEVLANASQRIESAFEDRPEIEASIRSTLGQVYMSLGLYSQAEAQLGRAVALLSDAYGPTHLETLGLRNEWIRAGLNCGPQWNALAASTAYLADCQGTLGEAHLLTLVAGVRHAEALAWRGDWANGVGTLSGVLDRLQEEYGEEHPLTLEVHTEWAQWTLRTAERRGELATVLAEALSRSRRTFGENHPNTLQAMVNLGSILAEQRRFGEAEPLIREGCDGLRRVLGESHPSFILATRDLVLLLREENELHEALQISREAAETARKAAGPDNSLTLETTHYWGTTLFRYGCHAEAADVFRDLWETHRRIHGNEGISTLQNLGLYSLALMNLGHYAEAEDGFRQVDQADVAEVANHTGCDAWCLRQLVRAIAAQGRADEARPFAERMLELRRQPAMLPEADAYALNSYAYDLLTVQPEDLRDPVEGLRIALLAQERSGDEYHFNRYTLALAYEANERYEDAVEAARRALAASPIEYSTERADYEATLARCLEQSGDPEGAEEVYRATLLARRAQSDGNEYDIAVALFNLGDILSRHGKLAEGESVLRECLETRQALMADPADETCPQTLECAAAQTMVRLGEALVGLGRHSEAESPLLEAHHRLSGLVGCHVEQVPAIAGLLVELYEELGQPDRARTIAAQPRASPGLQADDR